MNIVVLVACHKTYAIPGNECYLPIEVGAALHTSHIKGFCSDDTGKNISRKNSHYCELTALYWAWNNIEYDALGLVQYRRHFGKNKFRHNRFESIATKFDFESILQNVPVIVPRKRNYWIETNFSQYAHAHHGKDLQCTREIIQEYYPEYIPTFDTIMKRTYGHRFNMFVMKKDILNHYCQWLFSILFELENRVDIHNYDDYNQRIFGFIAERLLDCYLETNHITYAEMPVINLENQHWFRKIFRFLKRKFSV